MSNDLEQSGLGGIFSSMGTIVGMAPALGAAAWTISRNQDEVVDALKDIGAWTDSLFTTTKEGNLPSPTPSRPSLTLPSRKSRGFRDLGSLVAETAGRFQRHSSAQHDASLAKEVIDFSKKTSAKELPLLRLAAFSTMLDPTHNRKMDTMADAARYLSGASANEIGEFLRIQGISHRSVFGKLKSLKRGGVSAEHISFTGLSQGMGAARRDYSLPAPVLPTAKTTKPVKFLSGAQAVGEFVKSVQGVEVFGLDVETFGTKQISTVQLATNEGTWIIDAKTLSSLEVLKPILEGPATKVIHYSKFEKEVLEKAGIQLDNVFDTFDASQQKYGKTKGYSHSLAALVEREMGVRVEKLYQQSDWSLRPLSAQQMQYAALDAELMITLHDNLKNGGTPLPSNKGFGGTGVSSRATTDIERKLVARRLGLDQLPTGASLEVDTLFRQGALHTSDPGNYFRVRLFMEGTHRPFEMILPGKHAGSTYLTSNGSAYTMSRVGIEGAEKSVSGRTALWEAGRDIFGRILSPQTRPWERRSILRSGMERISKFSRYITPGSTSGAELQNVLQSNLAVSREIYEDVNNKLYTKDKDKIVARLGGSPNVHLMGPEQTAEGMFIMTNKQNRLAYDWYSGLPSEEALAGPSGKVLQAEMEPFVLSRPYQSFREISVVLPTEVQTGQGISPHINGGWKLDKNKGAAMRGGPLKAFNRWMPVNPGAKFEEELLGKYGYLNPHALTFEVIDDKKVMTLEKNLSLLEGEMYLHEKFKTRTSKGGYGIRFASPHTQRVVGAGVSSPFVDDYLKQGLPDMDLPKGVFLGLDAETGKPIFSVRGRRMQDRLIGVTTDEAGNRVLQMQRIFGLGEGTKLQQGISGGWKTTLKFIDDKMMGTILGRINPADADSADYKLLSQGVEAVTTSATSVKQGAYGVKRQVAGALKYWASATLSAESDRRQKMKGILGVSPLDYLQGKMAKGAAGTLEDFMRAALLEAREIGVFGSALQTGTAFKGAAKVLGAKKFGGLLKDVGLSVAERKQVMTSIEQASGVISWGALVPADDPTLNKGRFATLEARSLDGLMTAGWKLGDKDLSSAMIQDLMSAISGENRGAVRMAATLRRSLSSLHGGKLPSESMNVMGYADSLLLDKERLYPKKDFLLDLRKVSPSQVDAVADIVPERFMLPGEESLETGVGYYRQKNSGRVDFRHITKEITRNVSGLRDAKSPEEARYFAKKLKTSMAKYSLAADKRITVNSLGPASSFVQAAGVSDLDLVLKAGKGSDEWAAAGRTIGEDLLGTLDQVDPGELKRTVFLSQNQARNLTRGAKLDAVSKKAFMKGESSMAGMIWRFPTVGEQSTQPVYLRVHQGLETADSSSRVVIQNRMKNINILNESAKQLLGGTIEADLGMAPGMTLDFDKDMVAIKIMQEKNAISIMTENKAGWAKFEQQFEARAAEQQILSKVLKKQMEQVNSQAAMGGLSRAAYKQRYSKDIGPLSRALEEVKYAVLTQSKDQDFISRTVNLLAVAEETGTLKAKKLERAPTLSRDLASALSSGGGRDPDILKFISHLSQELIPEELATGIDYSVGDGETRTLKVDDDYFHKLVNTFGDYLGSDDRKVFDVYRRKREQHGRDLSVEGLIKARELAKKSGDPGSAVLAAMLGEAEAAGASRETIEAINTELGDRARRAAGKLGDRFFGAPILLGLAGSALAFGLLGDPGYSPQPLLAEGEKVDPRILNAIRSGELLNAQRSQEPQMSIHQPVGSTDFLPDSQFHQPRMSLSRQGTSTRMSIRDDMSRINMGGFHQALRERLNKTSINSRIEDRRRVLSPAELNRERRKYE